MSEAEFSPEELAAFEHANGMLAEAAVERASHEWRLAARQAPPEIVEAEALALDLFMDSMGEDAAAGFDLARRLTARARVMTAEVRRRQRQSRNRRKAQRKRIKRPFRRSTRKSAK